VRAVSAGALWASVFGRFYACFLKTNMPDGMGKAVYGCITAFLGAGSETWRQAAASSPGLGFVGEDIFAYIADLGRTMTPCWVPYSEVTADSRT
jgi:hypothetical protein